MIRRISPTRVAHFLRIAENGRTATDRGRAFEELISYVFAQIPGVSIMAQDKRNVFLSEEVDLVFWNEGTPDGLPFLPDLVLVECKNWSVPVGSQEVGWFDSKLRSRGLTFGVLIAAKGITGQATDLKHAHHVVATALSERRRIVVMTIQEVVRNADTAEIVTLFKKKLCELILFGTAFP